LSIRDILPRIDAKDGADMAQIRISDNIANSGGGVHGVNYDLLWKMFNEPNFSTKTAPQSFFSKEAQWQISICRERSDADVSSR